MAEQHNIANLIPSEGAALWSVSDCLFGNEKKERKPVKEFIERIEKYEGLKEVMLSIEGLVSGRSQHASSVIFYPRNFLDVNAKMKTTKGLEVTQFNADDGIYAGELKEDMLSISALGRIREAMNLLLEDGKIEWQGSLKATYDKYFHPDVLDLKSKEMFKLLADGEIYDAFQMSSLVARNAMRKIRPETFNEVAITNTLIRLQTDGEQPVDRFVRYKNDINEWYKDMKEYGLNETEISLMEEHLLERQGVLDTQEGIMMIVMDKRIGNSNLAFANKYRKAIAKKKEQDIEKCESIFKKNIIDNGHQESFADYIINEQIGLSRKYSFSKPHTDAYTLILMIEMNIAYKYGVGYWKTACANINAGLEGDLVKGADFVEISRAVNDMKDDIVKPDINKSDLKFTTIGNKTRFGLKAIAGLDINTLDAIIENRPFDSLEDYYNKVVEPKLISPKKTITLIKSGAMDSLEDKERRLIMADLVKLVIPQKEKITMSQIDYVRDIIPKSFDVLLELHDFRNKITGRNKIPMNKELEEEFINKYSNFVDYDFNDGKLDIDIKSFNKYYNKEIKPLKEEIKKDIYAKEFTKHKRKEYWLEECQGTPEEWEIETILYNTDKFVIDTEQIKETHKVDDFNTLPDKPLKGINSRGYAEYELSAITGVSVGYNHTKKLVYLLTESSGVVTLKMNKKTYAKYHEKTENSDSWWTRGNKLVLIGYKNGEAFNVRGNKIYSHPIIKVIGNKKYVYQNEKV